MHILPKDLFSLWKKAPQCFKEHPASYHVFIPKSKDVSEMTNDYLVNACEKAKKKVLFDVIRCLRYLAWQGISLHGNENNDNFTQLVMLLGTKDERIIAHLDGNYKK